jgi:hypothetical protein
MLKWAGVAAAICVIALPANAQVVPPVYISSEDNTPSHEACDATYPPAVSAIRSTLRSNDVEISNKEDYFDDLAIRAYVNINVIDKDDECAVAYSLAFETHISIEFPGTLDLGTRFATAVLCDKGGLIVAPTDEIRSMLTKALREITTECVTKLREYEG